jgi:hypothetical protein
MNSLAWSQPKLTNFLNNVDYKLDRAWLQDFRGADKAHIPLHRWRCIWTLGPLKRMCRIALVRQGRRIDIENTKKGTFDDRHAHKLSHTYIEILKADTHMRTQTGIH